MSDFARRWIRHVVIVAYVVMLIMGTGWFVGAAAQRGLLVWAALPLPAIPILGLHFLRPNERLAGWAAFTVWLGSTYAMSGEPLEVTIFALITVAALAGYFRTPWFLVFAWFAHIAWDFFPRALPTMFVDLPQACMIFDGLIGVYLAWMVKSGRMARRLKTRG